MKLITDATVEDMNRECRRNGCTEDVKTEDIPNMMESYLFYYIPLLFEKNHDILRHATKVELIITVKNRGVSSATNLMWE